LLAPVYEDHLREATANKEPAGLEASLPQSLVYTQGLQKPPPLNLVMHIVGSRGDVQPFIALGRILKETYNHRVRLATHPVFQKFVEENGLEFFSIGGDPAALMAFMVNNPRLMPSMEAIKGGVIGKRRKEIFEIMKGCWRSCFESGDGTEANNKGSVLRGPRKEFVADAIIANPPSFAHIHCAQKLGIPLHMMFT
jgi:Glycosyltransferase family 28 N-terminal domain